MKNNFIIIAEKLTFCNKYNYVGDIELQETTHSQKNAIGRYH